MNPSVEQLMQPENLQFEEFQEGPDTGFLNRTIQGVRVTHLPTGLVCSSTTGDSYEENKAQAEAIMQERLASLQRQGKLPD